MASCSHCKLPTRACLCHALPVLHSRHRFYLLYHPRETVKASNTGRLLGLAGLRVESAVWQRRASLESSWPQLSQAILVFPAAHTLPSQARVEPAGLAARRGCCFVIIDATWQQARKMYRQSPELQRLPVVSLPEAIPSHYQLRRNQQGLSTLESAAHLLSYGGEPHNTEALLALQQRFSHHYQASLSNHEPKLL